MICCACSIAFLVADIVLACELYTSYKKEPAKEIPVPVSVEDEIVSEEKTIWEKLLYTYLRYSFLEKLKEENPQKTNGEIREDYLKEFCKERTNNPVDFNLIKEYIEQLDKEAFLPHSDREYQSVDEELKNEKTLPKSVESFVLRVEKCYNDYTEDMLYQVARSADDSLKQNDEPRTVLKGKICFAGMAVAFYEMYLLEYSEKAKVAAFTAAYNIGDVFYWMYEKCSFKGDNNFISMHFLLAAESCFEKALLDYEKELDSKDVFEDFPYLSFYLTKIQYALIDVFGIKEQELIDKCVENAKIFIKYSDTYGGKENLDDERESCYITLKKLERD